MHARLGWAAEFLLVGVDVPLAAEFGIGRPGNGFHGGEGGRVAELHRAGKIIFVGGVGFPFQLLVAVKPQGAAAQRLLDVHVQRIFPGLGVTVVELGFKENAHIHAQNHFRAGSPGELVHPGNFHDGLGDGEGSVVDDIDKLKAAALFHRNIFQFPDGGFQGGGGLGSKRSVYHGPVAHVGVQEAGFRVNDGGHLPERFGLEFRLARNCQILAFRAEGRDPDAGADVGADDGVRRH